MYQNVNFRVCVTFKNFSDEPFFEPFVLFFRLVEGGYDKGISLDDIDYIDYYQDVNSTLSNPPKIPCQENPCFQSWQLDPSLLDPFRPPPQKRPECYVS